MLVAFSGWREKHISPFHPRIGLADPALDFDEPLFDRAQLSLDRGEAPGNGVRTEQYGSVGVGGSLPGEYGVQVARIVTPWSA